MRDVGKATPQKADIRDGLRLFAAGIVERFEETPYRSWTPISLALYQLAQNYLEATGE